MKCEHELLKLTGLAYNQIRTLDVIISEFKGEPVFIRTNICGSEEKPILVLLHGFASSGPLYFKIIGKLTQYFCLVLLDMLGMGSNSRPEDYYKDTITPQESLNISVITEFTFQYLLSVHVHLKLKIAWWRHFLHLSLNITLRRNLSLRITLRCIPCIG